MSMYNPTLDEIANIHDAIPEFLTELRLFRDRLQLTDDEIWLLMTAVVRSRSTVLKPFQELI